MDCFQLANIIWGEGGESDDHIVPYPEVNEGVSNKKEFNQEASTTKLTELKRPEAKTDFYERKLRSSSNLDNSVELPVSGYGTHAWPDLSLSSSAKMDQGSLGTEVSKNLRELGKFSSRIGKIAIYWNSDQKPVNSFLFLCRPLCLLMFFLLVLANSKHARYVVILGHF